MIDRKQLADALGRLDPRDLEVLDYSLRRHVPDNDLAAVFDCGPSEVARMRAAAVERLANDLGVQRGSDLGHVLTALLDQSTWDLVPGARPADIADPPAAGPPAASAASGASTAASASPVAGAAASPTDPATEAPAPAGTSSREPARSASTVRSDDGHRPVLGMLARGSSKRPATAPDGTEREGSRSWLIAASVLIAVLVAVGIGSVVLLSGEGGSSSAAEDGDGTRPFVPREEAIGEPFPSEPESAYRYPIAIVERSTVLMDGPGGEPKVRISAKTEWDSPRVLSVVERQGDWMAVLVPELDNGEVGWVHDDQIARLDTVGWAIKADISKRVLEVERDGEVIRRLKIGVGRKDHPTPIGRYAVTDKLSVTDPGSPYGCCVVALTGHQTKLPEGWPGGDRLAVHATPDVSGLGEAVSLGCMRADPEDARWMMDQVPLGTPVFVNE
ncbi:MAG TPA: L,D-transpeptidase [Thermoleophilaceae bacterium]|nr:L,D-transpeptidase [Thermoleophilaceae bacterium]